jgi:protein translocase SecG subunit
MIQTILTICSLLLIGLILLRIPQKDTNSQNFDISMALLGSPKNTDKTLQNITWLLCFIFLLLTGILSIS